MAHSPAPASGVFQSSSHASRRLSPSPPTQQTTISKRDKKRIGTEQRLKEIVAHFSAERDIHSRIQLNAILRDMVYITRANPYQNSPLDDNAIDMAAEYTAALGPGAGEVEANPQLGRYALDYVTTINDAMEERDARITEVEIQLRSELEKMKSEFLFATRVATVEQQNLKEAARNRVIQSVQTRRKTLNRDKDNADYTDPATLSHTASLLATAPASPGGPHGQRKTRHTRHKQDPENIELHENNKRKRKALTEFDHDSPATGTRSVPDVSTALTLRRTKASGEADPGFEPISLKAVFGARDLESFSRTAYQTVATAWSAKRGPTQVNGSRTNGVGYLTNGNISDLEEKPRKDLHREDLDINEDFTNLAAPAMDRTGSHTTRSTRNNHIEAAVREPWETRDDPERIYGHAVLEALNFRPKAGTTNKDLEAGPPSGLSTTEIHEDLALFQSLIDQDP